MTRKKIEYENEEFLTNQIITYIGNKIFIRIYWRSDRINKKQRKKGKIKYCRYFFRVRNCS